MLLAIESSCDDTAVALLAPNGDVVGSLISSQIDAHKIYGGVVPEIASRKHLSSLPLLVQSLLSEAKVTNDDLTAIAVTYAPGLIGSVLIGVNFAKSLAWGLDLPLIPVDHLEGHLLASFLDHKEFDYPFLGLLASGGHTHLYRAQAFNDYQLLGKTLDDAMGEAYDKAAKMLGLLYPGGPTVEKLAGLHEGKGADFTIPLQGKPTLNFSFSGMKTAFRNHAIKAGIFVEKKELFSYDRYMSETDDDIKKAAAFLCKGFQETMEKIVVKKFAKALETTPVKNIIISGGVAANKGIRKALEDFAAKRRLNFYAPTPTHCTDNASMIGYVALQKLKENKEDYRNFKSLNAASKSPLGMMPLTEIT